MMKHLIAAVIGGGVTALTLMIWKEIYEIELMTEEIRQSNIRREEQMKELEQKYPGLFNAKN